jgi:hypothetical protein
MSDKPAISLLTRHNWFAWALKCKLSPHWAYLDSTLDEKGELPAITAAQSSKAMLYLAERVHDDIAWVLTTDNPDLDPPTQSLCKPQE